MLEQALNTLGPCLSTELTAHLVSKHGLTESAARKRVSRLAPDVKRLAHLPFARSARFIYLQRHFGSKRYWNNLYAAIRAAKGPYARALSAVLARTALPLEHFRGACGAPIAQRKQISADAVLKRLVDADVLATIDLPGIGKSVTTKQIADAHREAPEQLAAHIQARLIAESALLGSIREWARNLAFASYNKIVARAGAETPLPKVGPFAWDMTGPSYLTATASWNENKIKPGWFVCDVFLQRNVNLTTVEPFLNKVRTIKALSRIGRTLFVFVAEGYEKEALNALRSEGVVPGTLASMFGKSAAEAFVKLVKLLSDAGDGHLDTAALEVSVSALREFDGAFGNMRGALFEFIVAELVRKRATAEVKLNKVCEGADGKAEVDVWEVKDGITARFIECKGVTPGHLVDDEEVEKWINTRIKRIRHHLEHDMKWRGPLPKFEMWTSGSLSPKGFELFTKTKRANARKFELNLMLPTQIRKEARSVKDKSLLNLLENHFLPAARRKT